ncbi:uncharacterized protein [Branchiostoma lanceolatum]|uniref:uncharacterized protein n=1 Tax=Branchiostoma lanceolatum TaxID=7740 RepID=UPI0034533064
MSIRAYIDSPGIPAGFLRRHWSRLRWETLLTRDQFLHYCLTPERRQTYQVKLSGLLLAPSHTSYEGCLEKGRAKHGTCKISKRAYIDSPGVPAGFLRRHWSRLRWETLLTRDQFHRYCLTPERRQTCHVKLPGLLLAPSHTSYEGCLEKGRAKHGTCKISKRAYIDSPGVPAGFLRRHWSRLKWETLLTRDQFLRYCLTPERRQTCHVKLSGLLLAPSHTSYEGCLEKGRAKHGTCKISKRAFIDSPGVPAGFLRRHWSRLRWETLLTRDQFHRYCLTPERRQTCHVKLSGLLLAPSHTSYEGCLEKWRAKHGTCKVSIKSYIDSPGVPAGFL